MGPWPQTWQGQGHVLSTWPQSAPSSLSPKEFPALPKRDKMSRAPDYLVISSGKYRPYYRQAYVPGKQIWLLIPPPNKFFIKLLNPSLLLEVTTRVLIQLQTCFHLYSLLNWYLSILTLSFLHHSFMLTTFPGVVSDITLPHLSSFLWAIGAISCMASGSLFPPQDDQAKETYTFPNCKWMNSLTQLYPLQIRPDGPTLLSVSKPGGIQHLLPNFKRPKLFPGPEGSWNIPYDVNLHSWKWSFPPRRKLTLISPLVHFIIIRFFLLFLTVSPFIHFVVIFSDIIILPFLIICLINVS